MSLFEDFIQREIPLRPFTPTDPPVETVPVRRGTGPRRLEFVELQDGEVLGKEGGVIKGVNVGAGSGFVRGYEHEQVIPAVVWNIPHNLASQKAQVTIWGTDNIQVWSDEVKIIDLNTIQVTFNVAQAGRADLFFL